MTFKKRGGIPTSIPHPQQKPPRFSPSPDACASPSPLKGEEKKGSAQGKRRGKKRRKNGDARQKRKRKKKLRQISGRMQERKAKVRLPVNHKGVLLCGSMIP